MKNKLLAFFVVTACLFVATSALTASWFLYGKVTWGDETAAVGAEIRLLQNGKQKSVVYTNQQGRYGFIVKEELQGEPSDYTIEVWANKQKVTTQSLSGIRRGEKQDIKLH